MHNVQSVPLRLIYFVGVEEERRFNFGCSADYPWPCGHGREQRKNFEMDTPAETQKCGISFSDTIDLGLFIDMRPKLCTCIDEPITLYLTLLNIFQPAFCLVHEST